MIKFAIFLLSIGITCIPIAGIFIWDARPDAEEGYLSNNGKATTPSKFIGYVLIFLIVYFMFKGAGMEL